MRIVNNALPQNVFEDARSFVMKNIGEFAWQSSEIQWAPGLKVGINGSCLIRETIPELKEKIESELVDYLPPYDELVINYHLWQRNSGIAAHTDSDYEFGATLYLNDDWHVNHGGIFVWQPHGENTMRALSPEANTLVINGDKELHFVTPVSPESPMFRVTLQIWGKKTT
tara:strand:+ start:4371 stop:4880 length:510 start_codon:yes stop_codon:yes gene_type:complete